MDYEILIELQEIKAVLAAIAEKVGIPLEEEQEQELPTFPEDKTNEETKTGFKAKIN